MEIFNDIIVGINIVFFFVLLYRRIKQGFKVDLANALLVIWLGSAFASLIFLHAGYRVYKNLSVFPSLFFCLLFYITIVPFLLNSSQKVHRIRANNELIKYLCIAYCLLVIIPGIEIASQAIPKLSTGMNLAESMADIHDDRQEGLTVEIVHFSLLGSLCWRFIGFSTSLPIFLLFYVSLNLNKKDMLDRKYKIMLLSGLVLVLLVQILYYFANSQRSMISRVVIMATGCFVFFYYQYNTRYRKKVLKWAGGVGLIIFLAIGFITFARFTSANERATVDHNRTIVGWTSLYLGEGLLNFNEYVWNMKKSTEGDVGFLYYKKMLGYDRLEDDYHRRRYWESRSGIPQHIFYTYIGVFVEDFTPIGALLVLLLITFLVCQFIRISKSGTMQVSDAYLLLMLFYVIANGYCYYAFGGLNKGARLWHELLICALFSISMEKKKLYRLRRI